MTKLLSPTQVAELLGVSRQTAARIMRTEMATVQVGGTVNQYLRVSEEELNRWYQRNAAVQMQPVMKPAKSGHTIERRRA